MKMREPILIGLLVFFGFLIAGSLGHKWTEALAAGITVGGVVWIMKTSGSKQKAKEAKELKRGG